MALQNYPTNRNISLVNRDTIVSTYDFFLSIVCLVLVLEAIIHSVYKLTSIRALLSRISKIMGIFLILKIAIKNNNQDLSKTYMDRNVQNYSAYYLLKASHLATIHPVYKTKVRGI